MTKTHLHESIVSQVS